MTQAFQPKPDDPALSLIGKRSSITIKNIKHAAFASEETHCFEATIYIDNKRSLRVSNDGHGGPNQYYHTKDQTDSAFKDQFNRAIIIGERYVQEHHTRSWDEYASSWSGNSELLDWLINDLMNEHFVLKEMRNVMKKKIVLFDKKDQQVYSFKQKPTQEAVAYYRKKHLLDGKKPWLFLNDLPEAESFYYWRKI